MTTRRRRLPGPPPPRGRSGRFGLLPPLGMRPSSVKTRELRIDPDGLAQRVRKAPAGARALETGESPACVDAPPFAARGGDQDPLTGRETDELALRELGVALEIDLPAGEARREAGVHPLLAGRERELVVGDDHGRRRRVVVEVDLAHTRRR